MSKIKKIIRNFLGIIFILIGIAGGFIPVFQGWVFVLLGFILIDFKKKEDVERWILNTLKKTGCGKKLAIFWEKIKHKNKDAISSKDGKISVIYKNINKMEK